MRRKQNSTSRKSKYYLFSGEDILQRQSKIYFDGKVSTTAFEMGNKSKNIINMGKIKDGHIGSVINAYLLEVCSKLSTKKIQTAAHWKQEFKYIPCKQCVAIMPI